MSEELEKPKVTLEIVEEPEPPTFVDRCLMIRNWFFSMGIIGIMLWWLIKILICTFAGICLL